MTLRRVYMSPTLSEAKLNPAAGIPRAIISLAKHLPSFGWEIVENPSVADLICHHAGSGLGTCDVAVIHGAYPTGEPGYAMENWHELINGRVIEAARTSKQVIVPSEWVRLIFARDMHLSPHVIGWGIDSQEWQSTLPHDNYVLWNKNRDGDVCTSKWVELLAKALPNVRFVSTFGEKQSNLTITGTLPHDQMKYFVQRAGVYLATTKETFGIGTLEALASGVPVLGFRHGAITDYCKHGYNSFLAEPGDEQGLIEGLKWCFKYRNELSINAIESIKEWTWERTAKQFADVYDSVLTPRSNILLSVIVPCYNYQDYVVEALDSIYRQQVNFKYEIIVVNDGSKDNSLEVIHNWLDAHSDIDACVIDQPNQGVAHARNNGIEAARGEFITCLDADDVMEPGYLQVCASALDQDRGLGLAYTGLQLNGNGKPHSFPPDFSWDKFKQRNNQVPSLCMFRKEAWQRAGKYRQYRATAEDADLYMRIACIGYRCKKVTDKPLFNYRMGHTSATTIVRQGQKRDPYTDPEYAYFVGGMAAGGGNYPVRNYDNPLISVIIPVGAGHEEYLKQALDSVEGQTFVRWECIVINDTGKPLDLTGYPFVRLLETAGKTGASAARNMGIKAANGSLITFLDADDWLHPTFLQKTLQLYKQTGRYVYCDWNMLTVQGELKLHECPEFSPNLIFEIGYFHPITCLIPTKEVKRIMFDEAWQSWEDVILFMELIKSGVCGVRLPEALLTYRYTTGNLREKGAERAKELRADILKRYNEYIEGGKKVACSCGNNTKPPEIEPGMELIKVSLNTVEAGRKTHVGLATQTQYRRSAGEVFYIRVEDQKAEPQKYVPVPDIQPEKEMTVIPPAPVASMEMEIA